MRGIPIVFIAFLAYSSAYPLEEQQVSVQVPESSLQVEASEKNAVMPDASEIVQIAKEVQSDAQKLLAVDAGGSVNIGGARQARQFGGYGRYGGYPGGFGGFGGGYGGYPGGYGGFPGGFGGFGGYGGYGGYGGGFGHRRYHG